MWRAGGLFLEARVLRNLLVLISEGHRRAEASAEPRARTPALDALAAGGASFAAAYAPHPAPEDALLATLTGRLLARRAEDLEPRRTDAWAATCLGRALRAGGRRVAAFGGGGERGQETFDEVLFDALRRRGDGGEAEGAADDATAEQAARWIAEHRGDRRWAAFARFRGPSPSSDAGPGPGPGPGPGAGAGAGAADGAAAATALEALDARLGRVLGALDAAGGLDAAFVVYASLPAAAQPGAPGGAPDLSDAAIGAPLLLRGPSVPAGRRVATAVSLLDLYPTLLAASGAPEAGRAEGEDLAGLTQIDRPGRPVMAAWRGLSDGSAPQSAAYMLRLSRFKLILDPAGRARLFDLRDDPEERRDRAGDPAFAEPLAACRAALARRLRAGESPQRP